MYFICLWIRLISVSWLTRIVACVIFVVYKVSLWQVLLWVLFGFPLSFHHIHLHSNTTLIKRTNGQSLGTFEQEFCFGYRGTLDKLIFSRWFLFSLQSGLWGCDAQNFGKSFILLHCLFYYTPTSCTGRCAHIFQKSWSQLKILGARRVAGNQFYAEDPLILGATVTNEAATATGCPGYTQPAVRI